MSNETDFDAFLGYHYGLKVVELESDAPSNIDATVVTSFLYNGLKPDALQRFFNIIWASEENRNMYITNPDDGKCIFKDHETQKWCITDVDKSLPIIVETVTNAYLMAFEQLQHNFGNDRMSIINTTTWKYICTKILADKEGVYYKIAYNNFKTSIIEATSMLGGLPNNIILH